MLAPVRRRRSHCAALAALAALSTLLLLLLAPLPPAPRSLRSTPPSAPSAPASTAPHSAPSAPASTAPHSAPSAPASTAPHSAPSAPASTAPHSAPSAPASTAPHSAPSAPASTAPHSAPSAPASTAPHSAPSAPASTAPHSAPSAPAITAPHSAPSAPASTAPHSAPSAPASTAPHSAPSAPASTAPHSAPHSAPSAPASTSPPSTPRHDPRVVLVRDVYEAGHSRPHPELCPALGARLRLLVLVSSAPDHAALRDAVRLTWGHYAARADVTVAFVLGASPPALRAAIDAEDALYGDVIEGHSHDSYHNLTLKTLSMLEWADTYCPLAPRLLKTDDDTFINFPGLLKFAAAPTRVNATRTIWGTVLRGNRPRRETDSKYYVSLLEFPGRVFPDYMYGSAYLMTADCVRELLAAAPAERYLPMEDAFVTGVLAVKLRLVQKDAPVFYSDRKDMHPCAVQPGLATRNVDYHEQLELWCKLLDSKTKCVS